MEHISTNKKESSIGSHVHLMFGEDGYFNAEIRYYNFATGCVDHPVRVNRRVCTTEVCLSQIKK